MHARQKRVVELFVSQSSSTRLAIQDRHSLTSREVMPAHKARRPQSSPITVWADYRRCYFQLVFHVMCQVLTPLVLTTRLFSVKCSPRWSCRGTLFLGVSSCETCKYLHLRCISSNIAAMKHHHQHLDDAAQLAAHGHKQELNRHFSSLYGSGWALLDRTLLADDDVHSAMLGLSFAILNVHLLSLANLLACNFLIFGSLNSFF